MAMGLYELILLKQGTRGDTVKKLQQKLGVGADGQFGPGTEKAVREYQKKNGLKADGMAGPATLAQMKLFPEVTQATVAASQVPGFGGDGRRRGGKGAASPMHGSRHAQHLGHHQERLQVALALGLPAPRTRRASPAARSWHGRGCDGYAGASRQPGSRYRSGSGRPRDGLSREPRQAPRDPARVPWAALRPRVTAFSARLRISSCGRLWALPPASSSRDSWLRPCISTRPLASSPSPCHADCC